MLINEGCVKFAETVYLQPFVSVTVAVTTPEEMPPRVALCAAPMVTVLLLLKTTVYSGVPPVGVILNTPLLKPLHVGLEVKSPALRTGGWPRVKVRATESSSYLRQWQKRMRARTQIGVRLHDPRWHVCKDYRRARRRKHGHGQRSAPRPNQTTRPVALSVTQRNGAGGRKNETWLESPGFELLVPLFIKTKLLSKINMSYAVPHVPVNAVV